jgi:cobalamin synthase
MRRAMALFFGIMAGIAFLTVIPLTSQMDSHRRGQRETAFLAMGAALTLMLVGIVGCVAAQA